MVQTSSHTNYGDTFFLSELERFGPAASPSNSLTGAGSDDSTVAGDPHTGAPTLSMANAYCRMWAHRQYENFTVVSHLLPRALRQDFYNVYAFCRWSDNLADEIEDRSLSQQLFAWWEKQLADCFTGSPTHPVMVALADTIARHQLVIDPFNDLLSAFKQDIYQHEFADEHALLQYCSRSANPVGRILLCLAKASTPATESLSDEICTGLQLANFCQDMSRDSGMGRIYAPQSLCDRHCVTRDMIHRRTSTPQLKNLLEEWVASTRGYFQRGWPLVDCVPRWLATDVDLFVRGGLAVLNEIEASGFDVWERRPSVSKWRKGWLLCQSFSYRLGWTRRAALGCSAAPTREGATSSSLSAKNLQGQRNG